MTLTGWDYFGILAILLLVVAPWIGRKTVWGAFGLGVLICVVMGIAASAKGLEFFNWILFKKVLIVSIYLGVIMALLTKMFKVSFKNKY